MYDRRYSELLLEVKYLVASNACSRFYNLQALGRGQANPVIKAKPALQERRESNSKASTSKAAPSIQKGPLLTPAQQIQQDQMALDIGYESETPLGNFVQAQEQMWNRFKCNSSHRCNLLAPASILHYIVFLFMHCICYWRLVARSHTQGEMSDVEGGGGGVVSYMWRVPCPSLQNQVLEVSQCHAKFW